MRKNIQHIQLVKSQKSKVESNQTNFHTAENIDLKKTYSKEDIEGFAQYSKK